MKFQNNSPQQKINKEYPFHRITLKFKDDHYNQLYFTNKRQLIKRVYYVQGLLLSIIFLFTSSIELFYYQEYVKGFTFLVFFLYQIISFYVLAKYPSYLHYLIFIQMAILSGSFYLVLKDQYLINQSNFNQQDTFITGCAYIIITILNLACIQCWYIKSFLLILSFNCIQISFQNINIVIILGIQTLLLAICLLFYFREKYDKLEFYKDEYNQHLIKEIIPTSMFICHLKEKQLYIDFQNSQCQKQFKLNFNNNHQNNNLVQIIDQIEINISTQQSNDRNINLKSTTLNKITLKDIIADRLNTFFSDESSKIISSQNRSISMAQGLKYFNENNINYEQFTECKHIVSEFYSLINYYDIKIQKFIQNNKPRLIVILDNVSEKVNNHKLLDLDKYKNQLYRAVSHNLKTPLNCIQSLVQTSNQQIDNDKLNVNLNHALNNCILLNCSINDILDYASINQGSFRLSPTNFEFVDLIDSIINIINYQANQKQVKIESEIHLDEQQCNNDFDRLQQIILNLLGNSIKFTFLGQILIKAEQHRLNQNIIIITISDTGIGMTQEKVNQLRELINENQKEQDINYQLQNNSHSHLHQEGVGFGLTIAKMILKHIGPSNSIEINSLINEGTQIKFQIYQNLIQQRISQKSVNFESMEQIIQFNGNDELFSQEIFLQDQDQELGISQCHINQICDNNIFYQQSTERKQILFGGGAYLSNQIIDENNNVSIQSDKFISILLVDDNPFNILSLKTILIQIGDFHFFEAFNGEQAIQKVIESIKSQKHFSLIFMDVNMPVMDGLEASKKIKKLIKDRQLYDIKIISVTAYTHDTDKKLCFDNGVDDYLKKPIKKEDILNSLKKLQFIN